MARIAVLLPDLRGGGVERIRIVLAHEFVRAGHEVEFVLMQARGELLEECRSSFPLYELGATRARMVPLLLARYLRRHRPDALLSAMWPLTVLAPIAQCISGHSCTVVVSEHGILSAQYQDWGRVHRIFLRLSSGLGYRLADHCVGVSNGVAEDMAALSRVPRDILNVIYNPVPPRTEPDEVELESAEQLWPAARGARILTVGTLKAVKNHALLLRAFALIERPDARLMIVGDGTEREALLLLARELCVSERVVFVGFQSDPTPFYMTADLFVLSSNYEGFGNVIVEALACGTPVVSTDCPSGPGEILGGGRHGKLVPVGDASALALAIKGSLDSEHDQDALVRRAGCFAPQRAARKYLELLSL